MPLIRQLQRLTLPRIQELLASLAAPEVAYPQLLVELTAKVAAAANAEAKARTAVAAAQRRAGNTADQHSHLALEQAAETHRRLAEMLDHLQRNRYRVLARARLTRANRPAAERTTIPPARPPARLLDQI